MANKDVIAKMLAGKKMVKVGDGEMELAQLNMKEMARFVQMQQKGNTEEALAFIIRTTLHKSMEISDAEIDNLKASFVNDLLAGIMEINELAGDKKKQPETSPSENESP